MPSGHASSVKPGSHEFEASRSGDRVVATLERATRQPGVRALVIDMGGVEFIDSAGLGLLLATIERLRAEQVRFELANPSGSVRRMLDLAGAADTLAVSAAPDT